MGEFDVEDVRRSNVLVVDDEAPIRGALSALLTRMSHTSVQASSPTEAIGVLGAQRFDLLITDSVQQIMTAGRHITNLLEEFLDIARIEAGRIPLHPAPTSVREIASEAIDLARPSAAERRITIQARGDDQIVVADPTRLRQIVLNLLSNATKYNSEGGQILVELTRTGESAVLSVTDTGPGIPGGQLTRIFVPFDRLDADNGSAAGHGVGLAVVKQLVELMGGMIAVTSEVGRGTTFAVNLPLSASASLAVPAPQARATVDA